MARRPRSVTDAEMAVLRVLWERGSLTAREITAAVYPDGGETEFASVHSFLQRLERKGLVTRDRSGFVHVFSAAVSQSDVAGQELEALAEKLAGGSLAPFLMHLVQRERLSEGEVAEIRRLLDASEPPRGKRAAGCRGPGVSRPDCGEPSRGFASRAAVGPAGVGRWHACSADSA